MWGCFLGQEPGFGCAAVFPTHVGVFLSQRRQGGSGKSLPHACGGVSTMMLLYMRIPPVFPTHVGVFPSCWQRTCSPRRLPHACGGVSKQLELQAAQQASSPRMWGCFYSFSTMSSPDAVFPTHVGVFPCSACWKGWCTCLPHACGGVSRFRRWHDDSVLSSPRMWGCFLGNVKTQGTVAGLPHACGGVSICGFSMQRVHSSSPRMWGCFRHCVAYTYAL